MTTIHQHLKDLGFATLRGVLSKGRCESLTAELADRMDRDESGSIRSAQRAVVGRRNLQCTWEGWRDLLHDRQIRAVIRGELGERCGVVRILFFDKPPGQSWSLTPHRDKTIAVREHFEDPAPYGKPTVKAGVPHVEASDQLLDRMLTLRFHFDAMHPRNGPLVVVPGSHQSTSETALESGREIHCDAGDVFVMKPLLIHASRAAIEGCRDHRRVLHLELAPEQALETPYHWYRYDAVA